MKNSIAIKNNHLGRRSTVSNKIVQAYIGQKVKDDPIQEIKNWMKKVFVILGLAEENIPEQSEYNFLAKSIQTELGYFTLNEMEYAVRLALHEELHISTDFYRKKFSLAWTVKLMKAYKEYRAKDQGFKNYLKAEFQLPEKSKQEQYATLRDGLRELWGRFNAGEEIKHELKWYYYSTLDDHCDLFNPDIKQKKKAMQRAEPLLEAKLKSDREKVLGFKGMIAASMPTVPNEDQLKNKAKELLMIDFFKGLQEMDMELELPETIQPKTETL